MLDAVDRAPLHPGRVQMTPVAGAANIYDMVRADEQSQAGTKNWPISATRLPDFNGNKRVCVCFSDGSDGNKGKAVIATINSANVVT